ncbi:E3 ubiquitin protein ligase RIE1 [Porphyridium purpureum]|uniref:E3 ubiquitin protein ligase RIE1 n=1 Tax=Porphyridium purpureum TaxID=35688 RepID=A0A5J4YII6_PORPP|nr:E3 ubiquitin protein ligase RIE1 [Porphyridium purpureum]|eukprot:POR7158..scf251_18
MASPHAALDPPMRPMRASANLERSGGDGYSSLPPDRSDSLVAPEQGRTSGEEGERGRQLSAALSRVPQPVQLRSNVASQMRRDLTPAARMLSIFLVSFEFVAEYIVLYIDWDKPCDSFLHLWVVVLMAMQLCSVVLGLASRSALDRVVLISEDASGAPRSTAPSVVFTAGGMGVATNSNISVGPVDASMPASFASDAQSPELSRATSWSTVAENLYGSDVNPTTSSSVNPDLILRWIRILNGLYLAWFLIGSIWVSDGASCAQTAPHLYRLVLVLTIIYYSLLGLPLFCFCLIMCCLPMFIRLMLPYAERAQRRGRCASAEQIAALPTEAFNATSAPEMFGSEQSCVICLSAYADAERLKILPCRHHFHSKCIDEWLCVDKSCPLCKADIDSHDTV